MDNWKPESQDERALKDAISGLQASINTIVKSGVTSNLPKSFGLDVQGIYDLRAYVLSGRDLPRNDNVFDRNFPMEAWSDIPTFDYNVLPMSKRTVVGVAQNCTDYYENHMSRLITASAKATEFADSGVGLVAQEEGINMREHLDVLLQDRYKSQAGRDDGQFRESSEAAAMSATMLQEEADTKRKDIDGILNSLVQFRSNTVRLLPMVKDLARQFKTGPVENGSQDDAKKRPYLEQLSPILNAKVNEVKKQLSDSLTESHEGKRTSPVGVAFVPCIGWVATGRSAYQEALLKQAYDELVRAIEDARRANDGTTKLAMSVMMIIQQHVDIDIKLKAAIDAMTDLRAFFDSQSNCYQRIESWVQSARRGPDFGAGARAGATQGLLAVVSGYKELKQVAMEFSREIVNEIRL